MGGGGPPSLEGSSFTGACWDSGDPGPLETYVGLGGFFPHVYQNHVGALKIFSVFGGVRGACTGLLNPHVWGPHAAGPPYAPQRTLTTPGRDPALHVHQRVPGACPVEGARPVFAEFTCGRWPAQLP